MRARRRAWELVNVAKRGDRTSEIVDWVIVSLIVLNVAAVLLDSVASVRALFASWFFWFEIVSVAVFTVEYLTRLYACVEDARYRGAIHGRVNL